MGAVTDTSYPTHLLEGCETGLVLFAAAFAGENDAEYFHRAGLRTTCVDIDEQRLELMSVLYPDDWDFVYADAWEYAEAAHLKGRMWDVVSADTFTGDMMRRSLGSLDLWCAIARKAVTATLTELALYDAPAGWQVTRHKRNDRGIYWLVLTRD